MDYKNELVSMLTSLEAESALMRKELKRYPKGDLRIMCSGNSLAYRVSSGAYGSKKRKYVGKNKELVRQLARRQYLSQLLQASDQNLNLIKDTIDKLSDTDSQAIIKNLPAHFDKLPVSWLLAPEDANESLSVRPHPTYNRNIEFDVLKLFLTEDIFAWGSRQYRQNDAYIDEKKIMCANGLSVRSKSENGCVEIYDKLGIAYHYDEVFLWQGHKISPDFVFARKRDGKLFYHEHCGLMDDSQYRNRLQQKLKLYANAGIVPWDNLVLTFDQPDGGIDYNLIETMIRSKLR